MLRLQVSNPGLCTVRLEVTNLCTGRRPATLAGLSVAREAMVEHLIKSAKTAVGEAGRSAWYHPEDVVRCASSCIGLALNWPLTRELTSMPIVNG